MIEVTRENFDILYTEIVDVIKKADFIGKLNYFIMSIWFKKWFKINLAIDTEFSGLESSINEKPSYASINCFR